MIRIAYTAVCSLVLWALSAAAVSAGASPAPGGLDQSSLEYSWDGSGFSVPLTIKDNSGVERRAWPVTTGVPLPFGLVQDVAQLRLVDRAGNEILCQFAATSRYWARDGSVRWVLLDFQVDLPAKGEVVLRLENRPPSRPIDNPLRINQDRDAIRVETGPLSAEIPKRENGIFRRVGVGGTEVLRAGHDDGPHLRSGETRQMERSRGGSWNTHGWEKTRTLEEVNIAEHVYRGGAPREVVVETQGPLRSVVRITGRHLPTGVASGVVKTGMYNYTTRLHFYKGHSFVKVEHQIENSDRQPPLWNYLFREAGLTHSLQLGGDALVTAGGLKAEGGLPAIGSATAGSGTEIWLYQRSGKVDTSRPGRQVVTEGVYSVGEGVEGAIPVPIASGRRGRFLDASDRQKGLAIAVRYMWEEAPRAIAYGKGRVQIRLQADSPGHLASEGGRRPEYDLDFGSRNLHDLLYYFHRGDAKSARVPEIAEAFEYPLFAHAPPAWYSDTGVWYFEISRDRPDDKKIKSNDGHWVPDGLGIAHHGRSSKGGSYNSGGHHESLSSGWLPFLRTGHLSEWERNLVLSRWAISQNPGWAFENNVLAFGDGARRFAAVDRAFDDLDRLAGFGPKDFYLWKSDETREVKTPRGVETRLRGGSTYLNEYKALPDIEHYALFRLFEYYYLTGDARALDAIHGFVNWGLNFQHRMIFRGRMQALDVTDLFEKDPDALWRSHYGRIYTWMLYTNLAGLHATGNPVFDEFARWQIRRLLAVLRDRHGQLTSWRGEKMQMPGARSAEEKYGIRASSVQSWMEAQGPLALHEAYKTYDDERILDGLWAQADYFAHHVVFFPRLGMINNWTSMPNEWLGEGEKSLTPQRHDHLLQALPYLYHYTGWADVAERYRAFLGTKGWVRDEFLQVIAWERDNVPKRTRGPEAITDLRVVSADRSGISLAWTSPRDDGPRGRAARYFVKYSDQPIVEFAPTDNPARDAQKQRVVDEVEDGVLAEWSKKKNASRPSTAKPKGLLRPEAAQGAPHHPDWDRVDAFWMAEHVAGEPTPASAGAAESFTIRELRPHAWFGAARQPGVGDLKRGTYYVAICSWDEERNLSRLSNVVKFELR